MLDLLILKIILNNTNIYNNYSIYITKYYNNNKNLNIYIKLFNTVKDLKTDNKSSHNVEDLIIRFYNLYPVLKKAEEEAVVQIFEKLATVQVSEESASELFAKLKERALATDLALAAVDVSMGTKPLTDLRGILDELGESEPVADGSEFAEDDLLVLKEKLEGSPPFKFRLKTLNQILGGLRRKTFGFFCARPEVGKTMLLSSEGTFLAAQTESCLLWINNEEDSTAIVTRNHQSALGVTFQQLYFDVEKSRDEYRSLTQGKLRIYDNPSAGYRQIEDVIRRYTPDIVFIDQLDKVRGFDAERYDLVQKAKYQWARELAKQFNCAVVGVCQAGGSAENKKHLDMNDVDSSHTAKQGEADWAFGLGKTDQVGFESVRYISMFKNKLPLVEGMLSDLRHAKVPILANPDIQRYEDTL